MRREKITHDGSLFRELAPPHIAALQFTGNFEIALLHVPYRGGAPALLYRGEPAASRHAAAQKALAGEIETRAQKLSQAGDDQFVLASDGAIRWTGDVVGVLVALLSMSQGLG